MHVLGPLASGLATQSVLSGSGDAMRLVRFGAGADEVARVPASALDALVFHNAHAELASSSLPPALVSAVRSSGARPGFIDVSEAYTGAVTVAQEYPKPNATAHPELEKLFAQVSGEALTGIVGNLTAFPTRFYRAPDGASREPALWLRDQFAGMVGDENVVLLENTFNQPNVIASLPRAAGSSNDELVIIGAHFDSVNSASNDGPSARAPGADDDASGTAIIFHALQILAAAGFRGARRVEVHAYAAEEGGLLGSIAASARYAARDVAVRGMLQFEMVGYQHQETPSISLTVDTSPVLQDYVSALVKTYIPSSEAIFRTTVCGYGCSDHASWAHHGYNAVALAAYGPRDKELNPNLHTDEDTLDKLNMAKATAFVKAALAFIVELAGEA